MRSVYFCFFIIDVIILIFSSNLSHMIALYNNLSNFSINMSKSKIKLTLRQTMLSKKHLSTLTSMNNLTSMMNNQDNYDEIEQIHRQTLINKTSHQVYHQTMRIVKRSKKRSWVWFFKHVFHWWKFRVWSKSFHWTLIIFWYIIKILVMSQTLHEEFLKIYFEDHETQVDIFAT